MGHLLSDSLHGDGQFPTPLHVIILVLVVVSLLHITLGGVGEDVRKLEEPVCALKKGAGPTAYLGNNSVLPP